MRKLKLVIHTSLDGFVAGEHGEFDELVQSPENLDFICSLTDEADALLAGRISFQMLDSYWPTAHSHPAATNSEIKYSKWYNRAEKIVLSRSLPESTADNVTILARDTGDSLTNIKSKEGKDILMFGSPSVHKTLSELNLIDEYWIILYPVLLGKGIPLFSNTQQAKKLKLLSSVQFTKGEMAIRYQVEN